MKKLGIILFSTGIIVMMYAAVNFIKDRKIGSEEDVEKQGLPFPWFPSTGAVLVAGGIILMATSKRKKV